MRGDKRIKAIPDADNAAGNEWPEAAYAAVGVDAKG
jgi:hypothetical protein